MGYMKMEILKRAMRNCFWDFGFCKEFLLANETLEYPQETISEEVEKALLGFEKDGQDQIAIKILHIEIMVRSLNKIDNKNEF